MKNDKHVKKLPQRIVHTNRVNHSSQITHLVASFGLVEGGSHSIHLVLHLMEGAELLLQVPRSDGGLGSEQGVQ